MKTVLVTGANGNLGVQVVKKLLGDHHRIISVVGKDGIKDLPENPDLETWMVDLMDEDKVKEFIESTLEKNRNISAAVLLVGGFAPGKIQDTGISQIEKMIRLNFHTAYNMVRFMMPHFLSQPGGGQFILIGTRPAMVPDQGKDLVAYSLSKSLVFRLAEMINAEGSGKQVSATVIVPSTIDTEPNRKSMPDADFSSWVPPERIADTVTFVLSDAGKMLRDTVLKVYNRS